MKYETVQSVIATYAEKTHREVEIVIRTNGAFKAFAYENGYMICEWANIDDMLAHMRKFV